MSEWLICTMMDAGGEGGKWWVKGRTGYGKEGEKLRKEAQETNKLRAQLCRVVRERRGEEGGEGVTGSGRARGNREE